MTREGAKKFGNLADLPAAKCDSRLHDLEKIVFFRILRQRTIEGMFSDPLHGENAGLIGEDIDKLPGQFQERKL